MPSSLLEASKHLGGSSEPSQQADASESIGARTIVLTFPGFPSCCTEILIDFEDYHGSDSKGTQSEEAEMWPPQHDLPASPHEESDVSQTPKPSEDAVAHEFDQSTVYIGLESGLTVGTKKARKKTDSLVRTLPILAHCSKRWLHFRGKKSHERGRICAFESGDVGKKIHTSISVEDRNDSPRQKCDTKQTFVSPRAPFTFVNPKATFSMTTSHDRKKSLERSQENKAAKYSSRKSKSGVGISEMKQEIVHGEEMEMVSTKKKYGPLLNQLQVDNVVAQSQVASCKRTAQVEFDISSSHEKVKKCAACRFSEIKNDHCKVRGASDLDRLPVEGVQFSSQNSVPVSGRVSSPCASNVASSTTGHKVLDTMFIDVIKLMLAQEDPDNALTSSPLSEREENPSLQATVDEATSHQQIKEHSAVGNNEIRSFDKDIVFDNLNLRQDGSLSKNVLHPCEVSELNFPGNTSSCDKNVSGDRSFSSQYTTTEGDSNNCHLCSGGDVHECKELTTVVDAVSCSDDLLLGVFVSNDEVHTAEHRKYDFQEIGSRTCETFRSLQVELQSVPNEKHNGRWCRNSNKNTETFVVSVIPRSTETVQSSSDGSLSSLQHCEGSRGASNCDVSEESVSDLVATKEKSNPAMLSNEKDALSSLNPSTGIDNDATAHPHTAYQCVIGESSMGNNHVYSATSAQGYSSTYSIGKILDSQSMATEEDKDSESQFRSTEIEPLANETGTRKSIHEFSAVPVKSLKLHTLFSKSSDYADSIEDCHRDDHQTSGTSKNSGKIHSALGKLHAKTPLVSVNSTFGDKESRLVESEKPQTDCSSATLLAAGSTNAEDPTLLRHFITLEKHKGRLLFASSFIVRAKTALSRVRSRSLSPTALGAKIRSLFLRAPKGRALPKKTIVPVGRVKGPRQRAVSKRWGSSRQCEFFKQWNVSKKVGQSRETAGTKQMRGSSVISEEELQVRKVFDIENDIRIRRANQATIRDGDGTLAKEKPKLFSIGPHIYAFISFKLEHNRQRVFRFGKFNTSHSKETKPRRSQSWSDITSKPKFICAMGIPNCAASDNSSPSDLNLSHDLRRRFAHIIGPRFKNLEQAQTSPPFTMAASPVLESIANADSPSEESKADGEAAQLKCEQLFARQSFTKDSISKVATLGRDDGPRPVSAVGVSRGQHTRGRKSALRMSSSYEDCKRESGDFSLCNGVCMPAPMKTHSLVSNLEPDQSELQAINDMPIISQEVKIKRCPSFPNLTAINNEDYSITSVITSGSNTFSVSVNTFEKDDFPAREDGQIKHRNSSQTDAFSTPNTQLDCNMMSNGGCTMKQNMQMEFSPNLVERGKMKSGVYSCSRQFTLTESETQVNIFSQTGNGLETCEDTVSCSRYLATEYNIKNVQPKNSAVLSTPENNRCEVSADLLSLEAEKGRAVTEFVSMQISPPGEINNEMLIEGSLVKFNQKNISASSKLMSGTDNCDSNLEMLRVALFQGDISEVADMPVVKDANDILQGEGRQLREEAEQISLAIVCNYFPFERRQFDSQESVENEQPSCLKQEEHVHEDISSTIIDENKLSRNTVCGYNNSEDGVKEVCANVFEKTLLLSHVSDTTISCCEDRVNNGDSLDTSSSKNTANEVSTNAKSEIPTNAISQLSTKLTNQQHSTNTTSQLCTNTTNQELYENSQSQCDIDTYHPSLGKDNPSNVETIDSKMIYASLVDPNTSVTLKENLEDNATSCRRRTSYVEHENPRNAQCQLVCDNSLLVTAETAYTPADDAGGSAAVKRQSTSPGPFRHANGSGNVLHNASACKKHSTVQAKAVLDICNSSLSDVVTEDQTPCADSVSLDGKRPKTVTTASSEETLISEKRMKINNKKCVLRLGESKTKPGKSETVLVTAGNAKKKKQGGYQSAADIPKRCPKGKKDKSRNVKSVSKCGAKITDLDISSFNTSEGGKQFVVTSVSSIFGAPDKMPIFGLKSVRDLACRSVNVLKGQSEVMDEEDSDTLTISEKNQTQNFNIAKDLKSQYNSFENQLPTVNSQFLNDQMVNIDQVAKTDVNIRFFNSSLNSAPSYLSVDHNKLDTTVTPDNALDILNQINLSHSDRSNPYSPQHVLETDTSFCESISQVASVPFPVKRFPGGTMPKRLLRRVSWSDRTAPTKDDFTYRTQHHLRRCDELLQRSTGILIRSQEMSCRVQRQMEHAAEELKLMNYAARCQPEQRTGLHIRCLDT
ncbi:hypothetical protein BsWGS_07662 [Bradybaena similaris]